MNRILSAIMLRDHLRQESPMRVAKDLGCALIRHPLKIVANSFTSFSVLFTLVKIAVQFFPTVAIQGAVPLCLGIVISLAWALDRAWKPSKTEFKVATCN